MDDEIISTVNEQKARDLAIAAQCERENKNERYDTYHSKRVGSFDGYLMQVMMNALHRMQDYQNYIVDLERDMESVKGQRRFSPDVLQKIMRDQHDAYQALSSKVSSLHQLVEGIREDWTEYVLRNELSNDPVAERRKKSGRPGMLVGAGGGDFNSDKRPGMGPKANSGFDITKLVTMGTVAPGIAGAPGTANLSTGTTTGGGLFGGGFNASKPAFGATTQPATSGFGGFGMAASTPLKSTTGGLFGSSMTTANTGLGGFGQSTTNTTAPSATGFAGFGAASKPAATPSTATFSGFTSTAQPASTGGFSGFGSTATQPAASGFSGFTASKPAAPASQPFTLNTNSSNTTGGGFSFGK
ncbi:hypothetical protein SARC_04380 [Sphaeroforma arctica JP610]|uniref:Nucleoporin NSP1-like C-terminal domain-containing protein n=1 Tax=Sphaeroforma arctica JP610 TaxID=667725 RepID=A0A0L0G2K9_9EUKA|nr:hypothetical protein SARC_04380 [Sphaeroforma arctica JP610]KNC83372.1 hypothetical protein SARC_04380 [Sphaeroforma arctica JP610]|eukprot:XP_014157274.1 hypothetical protein SARC_04380 [Sphaeroforma arctica JP610]